METLKEYLAKTCSPIFDRLIADVVEHNETQKLQCTPEGEGKVVRCLYAHPDSSRNESVRDEDIRNYTIAVLNRLWVSKWLTFENILMVNSFIQKYNADHFVMNMPTITSFGNEASKLAYDFCMTHYLARFNGIFYLYKYGAIVDGVLCGGYYTPVEKKDVGVEVNRYFVNEIFASKDANLQSKITNYVMNTFWTPDRDYFMTRGILVFRDGTVINADDNSKSYLDARQFASASFKFMYSEILNASDETPVLDFICARVAPAGDVQRWKFLLLRIISAFIVGNSMKHIFVFRGCHSSFKSFIVNYILKAFWNPGAIRILRPQHTGERFELHGIGKAKVILVADAEKKKFSTNSVSIMKQISGGDAIPTEAKNINGIKEEEVTAPILIVTNNDVDYDDGEAFQKRLVELPFTNSVSIEDGEWCYREIFKELPAIFRAALNVYTQCRDTNCLDIKSPYEVNGHIEKMEIDRKEDDSCSSGYNPLEPFLLEHCQYFVGGFITSKDLYRAYINYLSHYGQGNVMLTDKRDEEIVITVFMKDVKKILSDLYPSVKEQIYNQNQKKMIAGHEVRGLHDFILR